MEYNAASAHTHTHTHTHTTNSVALVRERTIPTARTHALTHTHIYIYIYMHTHIITVSVVRVSGYGVQRFGSRRYQIFWEVLCLERGPLSLVSTTEDLPESKRRGSGLESREYGRRDPSRWPHGTLNLQKLALTSPTSGSRSVSIVRSRFQAAELWYIYMINNGLKYIVILRNKIFACIHEWKVYHIAF
jgi:hypothetical protein